MPREGAQRNEGVAEDHGSGSASSSLPGSVPVVGTTCYVKDGEHRRDEKTPGSEVEETREGKIYEFYEGLKIPNARRRRCKH